MGNTIFNAVTVNVIEAITTELFGSGRGKEREGCSVSCPYGDGITKTEYFADEDNGAFDSYEEAKEVYKK